MGFQVTYFSKLLKHWWETSPNKAFKADSQRLAISLPVGLSV
ncbi:hypothetical protein D020_4832 [Vibrio parahaemolyticus SBR10290]|nr:hypothetical protein D052_3293 [Vibrio parahaemolyticus 10290]ESV69675.1 hypothetical protein D021_1158 [Vibrio parahaemolyticus 10296]ESW45256.1 hypothetical protein D022_1105 [Vibrio parahaemolyticus 12310]ETT15577.1 hypothetical protein D023_4728 [Vibrio parahaemolyticus 3256]ETX50325.1 hypothetical protein D020_4832 [Vibrio parahaemolyticus SBR10290]